MSEEIDLLAANMELTVSLSKWKSLAGEFKLALQALMESDGVGEFIEAYHVLAKAREMGLK